MDLFKQCQLLTRVMFLFTFLDPLVSIKIILGSSQPFFHWSRISWRGRLHFGHFRCNLRLTRRLNGGHGSFGATFIGQVILPSAGEADRARCGSPIFVVLFMKMMMTRGYIIISCVYYLCPRILELLKSSDIFHHTPIIVRVNCSLTNWFNVLRCIPCILCLELLDQSIQHVLSSLAWRAKFFSNARLDSLWILW